MKLIADARRIGVALAAALILAGPASTQTAQAYAGDWEGAVSANGQTLRVLLHIIATGSETTATLDSLDQGVILPATAVKTEGGELSILFLAAGAELKGKLSTDGQTIDSSWTQGIVLPLKLTRKAAAK